MIIAIADDITGAAELCGIGLRYGLRTLLAADIAATINVDLLVVYTNSRSMSESDAVNVMTALTRKAKQIQPSLFYKKTDSVLRGHVLAELKAQMAVLNLSKALLVPANPLLGRVIKQGQYFIYDVPVHQTSFATDPEFPIKTSVVKDMLREEGATQIASVKQCPAKGVTVGEARTVEDIMHWADYKEPVLFAGAACFFNALLQKRYPQSTVKTNPPLSSPLLFVSGTTYKKSIERRAALQKLVVEMPPSVYTNKDDGAELNKWATTIITGLTVNCKSIVAVGNHASEADPSYLRENVAKVVGLVMKQVLVKELLIEGGSTAFTILQHLGFQRFTPTEELQQGVVRMRVNDLPHLHLTIKPGSYDWPAEWNFN